MGSRGVRVVADVLLVQFCAEHTAPNINICQSNGKFNLLCTE